MSLKTRQTCFLYAYSTKFRLVLYGIAIVFRCLTLSSSHSNWSCFGTTDGMGQTSRLISCPMSCPDLYPISSYSIQSLRDRLRHLTLLGCSWRATWDHCNAELTYLILADICMSKTTDQGVARNVREEDAALCKQLRSKHLIADTGAIAKWVLESPLLCATYLSVR